MVLVVKRLMADRQLIQFIIIVVNMTPDKLGDESERLPSGQVCPP